MKHDSGMSNDDVVMTAAEVGELAGCSGRTITRRADAGELKILRKLPGPNGDYLFDRAEVERYLATLAASA